jgi:hypothetical protein
MAKIILQEDQFTQLVELFLGRAEAPSSNIVSKFKKILDEADDPVLPESDFKPIATTFNIAVEEWWTPEPGSPEELAAVFQVARFAETTDQIREFQTDAHVVEPSEEQILVAEKVLIRKAAVLLQEENQA